MSYPQRWCPQSSSAVPAPQWAPESVSTSIQAPSDWLTEQKRDSKVAACWKLCEDGQLTQAVGALNLLVHQGYHLPYSLFYRALKRCIAQKNLVLGTRIHALTVRSGYEGHSFLTTHLISLYASHGRLEDAMQVFSKVSVPDTYNWSSILFAYARHGEPMQAIELYRQMRQSNVKPESRAFVAVLKACANLRDLAAGKDVHAHIVGSAGKPDMYVQTGLVDMYAKCGSIQDARRVFDVLHQKDVVTWTAMIAGYAQQGLCQEALDLYSAMQQEHITPPNSVTFLCLLQACASVGVAALNKGKQLHAQIEVRRLQNDSVVGSSLVNMYIKCGSLEDARRVFDRLFLKTVVAWTAMIAGYTQQGMGQEALTLYSTMQQEGITPPDCVTFVCLLQACAAVGQEALHQGKHLHRQIEEQALQDNVVIGASLVTMYAKCCSVEDAQRVFDTLPQKNAVTWTAMIGCYAQQGKAQEALSLYSNMQQDGMAPPDSVTFVCLLQACASVAALSVGKQLHAQIEEQGWHCDVAVASRLVNMYAKCGSVEDAQQVFDSMAVRDTVAWSALIAGYTRQGDSEIVFDLFNRMRKEGVHPNSITFLSVLTVCSHVGLVDKGRQYFEAMGTDYGISPTVEHYTCMLDLLGRAGHLNEALCIAKSMPVEPNRAVWLTLLGACRKWSNVEVGRQAFECAVSLDEYDAASYGLMSNIYAEAGMWEQAQEVQARRLDSGAWKQPGQSWCTDMGGVVHTFLVGDGRQRVRFRCCESCGCKNLSSTPSGF